jgi:hypothetical protein
MDYIWITILAMASLLANNVSGGHGEMREKKVCLLKETIMDVSH